MESCKRNNSIDIFRYICALMVVSIHTHPFEEFSASLQFLFSVIIPRIAVPFFFSVSGYFYIHKALENPGTLFIHLKKILKIYFILSTIYFLADFIEWGYLDILAFFKSCLVAFFIHGSHYHLWYFPALIVSMILTSAFVKLRIQKLLIPVSLVFYCIGCLGTGYYGVGIQIPILSHLISSPVFNILRRIFFMGFPFFVSGYLVRTIESRIHLLSPRRITVCLIAGIFFWLAEIALLYYFKVQNSIILTFGLYGLLVVVLLLLLQNPAPDKEKAAVFLRTEANFLYYFHPLCIQPMIILARNSCPILGKSTVQFVLAVSVCFVAGLLIHRSHNQVLKRVFL